jgi:hypothetical protein
MARGCALPAFTQATPFFVHTTTAWRCPDVPNTATESRMVTLSRRRHVWSEYRDSGQQPQAVAGVILVTASVSQPQPA